MKTEDVPLDIKGIFDRKRIVYTPADVARMRYLCTILIENMIELHKVCNETNESEEMEKGNMWSEADGIR